MSDVRICPDCELEATRRPELDTATQIAFRCPSHWHKAVFENAPPKAAEPKPKVKTVAVTETTPITDAPKGTV